MTKHIHFDESASIDAHISEKQSIMAKLADSASTGVYSVDGGDYELTENDGMGWNPVNNFSVAIDYKNRKLIIGGFSNNKVRVFSE